MAEVAKADEAFKASKLQLKSSSKIATSAGAHIMVAHKFLANQNASNQSNIANSDTQIINLHDVSYLTGRKSLLEQPSSKTWARRLSLSASGASAAVTQFAKRFAASDDANQSVSSMPASRSMIPTRPKRRSSLVDVIGGDISKRQTNRSILGHSKSMDDINFDNEIDLASDGEPMNVRSYESVGIKKFSDNAGELLEGWGSKHELLEDFVPRNNRRSSMGASPPRTRVTARANRRSSMDEKSRFPIANNRVPLALTFKRRSSFAPSSISSGITLGEHLGHQESNDALHGGGGRCVEDLFPKREKQDHQVDDSYISGLVFFAPSREKAIRRIISRSEQDSDDDVSVLNTEM